MNEDLAFDRVKMRKARAALDEAGLSAARIAAAAAHLARARESLEIVTEAVLERACARFARRAGSCWTRPRWPRRPAKWVLRALASVLMAVCGQAYRPRFESLERLFDALIADGTLTGGATLHGCHISPAPRKFARLMTCWCAGPEKPKENRAVPGDGKNRPAKAAVAGSPQNS